MIVKCQGGAGFVLEAVRGWWWSRFDISDRNSPRYLTVHLSGGTKFAVLAEDSERVLAALEQHFGPIISGPEAT